MFTNIEKLLADRLGFDIQTVGPRAVEAVLQRSMENAGFSDPEAYARIVATDAEAWNGLVDRIVVPETWFFRDRAPFDLAAELVRQHIAGGSDRVFRILSCPCSTGEEPYSVAMAMLHAGAPSALFIVDALDVSPRALESASRAVFGKRSFRNEPVWYRQPYFERTEEDGFWRIKPLVTSQVRFREGNLISSDFLKNEAPYDLIFCRNVLIYLHSEARSLAMEGLRRLLAENGVLVLGHAEAAFAREYGFSRTGPPAAFAFAKSKGSAAVAGDRASRLSVPSSTSPRASSFTMRGISPNALPTAFEEAELELNIARRLGDAGQIDEALVACSEYVQRVPDSAEGYFLLGVLHDALGRFELAATYFRKVLYLDPAHSEALLHLALKQEALGDVSGAALLRARAQRTKEGGTAE